MKKRVLKLYKEGISGSKIAKKCNISRQRVSQILNSVQIDCTKCNRVFVGDKINKRNGMCTECGKFEEEKKEYQDFAEAFYRTSSRSAFSTLLDLLYIKVKKNGECLEYENNSKKGYASLNLFGKIEYAHRASYILQKGDIPAGKFILHKCDNPKCVNIKHLYEGDAKQNAIDRWTRSTKPKFTDKQIRNIRKDNDSIKEIAIKYNSYSSAICAIKKLRMYKRVK